MSPTENVIVDQPQPGVTRLTLARPDSLNALSAQMMAELQNHLAQVAQSNAIEQIGRAHV